MARKSENGTAGGTGFGGMSDSGRDDYFKRTLQELQKQRRRLEDFARATSDWFWETDANGHLIHLSERMSTLSGMPAASFLGKRLDQIGVFMQTDVDEEESIETAMRRRRPFRDRLFQFSHASGRTLIFHLAGVPVFDSSNGRFQGYRGAGFDMTPRYHAEAATERARKELEEALETLTNKNIEADFATAQAAAALREKDEFITSLSHELRTPLSAIIGFAEAMSMQVFGPLDERYRQYSDDILGASRHVMDLINDILDRATVESGRMRIDPMRVKLADVIEEAVSLVCLRARNKNIDLSLPDPGTIELAVDPRRAKQILVNLLSNAVKFTPEGGRMGIEIAPLAPSDKLLQVTIWDSGIGIPAREHDKVFERFKQVVDDDYARRQEGTGLGLAISRDLARMMGGDITLDSDFGAGSRFTVTLPLASDE